VIQAESSTFPTGRARRTTLPMMRSASMILIMTALCVAPIACGGEPAPKVKKSQEDEGPSAADNVKFELPAPPDFDEGKVAEKWEDRSEEHTSELQSRENLVCR